MRRIVLPLAVLVIAACSKGSSNGPVTSFRVAAASSTARALEEMGKAYKQKTGIEPVFDFGSSGMLVKQIEHGAPFVMFAAADKDFAQRAVKTGKCDASTLQLYSRGRIVVWGKGGSPARLEDLADPKYKRIAIANPDAAPYGHAAVEAMKKAGIYDRVKDRLVLAESVQAAQTYATEGQVDVGFSALSLALSAGSTGYLEVAPDLHTPLEQSMVLCGKGPAREAAREFAQFMIGDEGRAIMEKYGFSTTGVLPPK